MPEGLFITRVEFNQLLKKIDYLEQYVRKSMSEKVKSRWMTPAEAMQEIGCKSTKLKTLRYSGALDWRFSGSGKGVMILRKSVEDYNNSKSTIPPKEYKSI